MTVRDRLILDLTEFDEVSDYLAEVMPCPHAPYSEICTHRCRQCIKKWLDSEAKIDEDDDE